MIHVDRDSVSMPEVLVSERAANARLKATKYFDPSSAKGSNADQRLQERFDFDASIWREARTPAFELFQGKCAFCESRIMIEKSGDIDHFRPKSGASGLEGKRSIDHFRPKRGASGLKGKRSVDGYWWLNSYWWLAYEWDNLYLMCFECSRSKRNLFPVVGARATPGQVGEQLRGERSLLLDPCVDDPARYLSFDRRGLIHSRGYPTKEDRKRFHPHDRGELTIEILNLNRPELVQERRRAVVRFTEALKVRQAAKRQALLNELLAPDQPHVGVCRQLHHEWVLRSKPKAVAVSDASSSLASTSSPTRVGLAVGRRKARKRAMPAAHAWYIKRVEIENYKAIGTLRLDIPTGDTERTGWKVLLGENGTGKSSMLEALALALMGERHFRASRFKPAGLLRRLPSGKRTKRGTVKIVWRDRSQPWIMRFTAKSIAFEGEAPPPSIVLRAYGAARHLPRISKRIARVGGAPARHVTNLFDPFRPVCDANAWLIGVRGKEAFGSLALSLKDLFGISTRARVSRERGQVFVRIGSVDVTLDELSDGFQAVLVLAVDIMAGVRGQAHDLRHATGIVLLDEIDAHLHPRWKMQIVKSMRNTFPGMQFIATTHEPLCLRGLGAGEIALMRRDVDRKGVEVYSPEDLSTEGLRIDQILTSPLFGLHSTIDPDLDTKFRRYYALLGKQTDLETKEVDELNALRKTVGAVGVLGTTPRDQLIYEVIDEYLAREPRLADMKLRRETKERVANMWRDVATSPVGAP